MKVVNCKKCGIVFRYHSGIELCDSCKKETEVNFNIVKDYIRKHPNKTIDEISKETNVSKRQVLQWINEGIITTMTNSISEPIRCRGCNIKIEEGIFCENCKKIFKYKEYKKEKPKMHFLNKH